MAECYYCEQPILPTDAVWAVKLAHFVGLEKHYGPEAKAHASCASRARLTSNVVSETLERGGVMVKECDCPET